LIVNGESAMGPPAVCLEAQTRCAGSSVSGPRPQTHYL